MQSHPRIVALQLHPFSSTDIGCVWEKIVDGVRKGCERGVVGCGCSSSTGLRRGKKKKKKRKKKREGWWERRRVAFDDGKTKKKTLFMSI